jgi:hypothetical protein
VIYGVVVALQVLLVGLPMVATSVADELTGGEEAVVRPIDPSLEPADGSQRPRFDRLVLWLAERAGSARSLAGATLATSVLLLAAWEVGKRTVGWLAGPPINLLKEAVYILAVAFAPTAVVSVPAILVAQTLGLGEGLIVVPLQVAVVGTCYGVACGLILTLRLSRRQKEDEPCASPPPSPPSRS